METSEEGDVDEYGIVANIPATFHSADLRNYFSQFVEEKGFMCFHFKHRPETKILEKSEQSSSNDTNMTNASAAKVNDSHRHNVDNTSSATAGAGGQNKTTPTLCCIVRLQRAKMAKFLRMYHRKSWIDKKGSVMSSRCFISRIKIDRSEEGEKNGGGQGQEYQTRGESRLIPPDRETFTKTHLHRLAELNPPDLMPNGNVGTPTAVFLELIRTCRLPPRVIQKLGLTFPKTRTNRRYGNVPFAYGGEVEEGRPEERVLTASGQEITEFDSDGDAGLSREHEAKDRRKRKGKKRRAKPEESASVDEDDDRRMSESDEDDDDDTCEEWERHEALHEDVTSQGRTKERLFEEEIELKWEKGGSGLVFYTDAAFWDAKDGDFDEKTSDDWDVDMSIYYDEHGGDKDARDHVEMRRMERMKQGLEDTSVFAKPGSIGQFEKHTKGIGRKVLQKQGWAEGRGLGRTVEGMSDALDSVGQHTRDKRGFGYHGEKLVREGGTVKRRRTADKEVIISTVYDDPAETDPTEPPLRSRGPYHLKYRHEVEFIKADQTS